MYVTFISGFQPLNDFFIYSMYFLNIFLLCLRISSVDTTKFTSAWYYCHNIFLFLFPLLILYASYICDKRNTNFWSKLNGISFMLDCLEIQSKYLSDNYFFTKALESDWLLAFSKPGRLFAILHVTSVRTFLRRWRRYWHCCESLQTKATVTR